MMKTRTPTLIIRPPHSWNVTAKEAVALQETLRRRLILEDAPISHAIQTVAGGDISYARGNDTFFAAVLLLAYPEMTVIEEATAIETVSFPYIPGLLSFREGPALVRAFAQLTRKPDLVIFDGQGIAHPRGIGLASHMGLILDIPAIGCAKSRLVGDHGDAGDEPGSRTPLVYRERPVGAVLRTKKKVNPVFVSPGHRIGIERACEVILACCRGYRLPEPTRLAHLAVNRLRQQSGRRSE